MGVKEMPKENFLRIRIGWDIVVVVCCYVDFVASTMSVWQSFQKMVLCPLSCVVPT